MDGLLQFLTFSSLGAPVRIRPETFSFLQALVKHIPAFQYFQTIFLKKLLMK